jgi:hypothetical protein
MRAIFTIGGRNENAIYTIKCSGDENAIYIYTIGGVNDNAIFIDNAVWMRMPSTPLGGIDNASPPP